MSAPPVSATPSQATPRRRRRIGRFLTVAQGIIFFGHWLIFETVSHFWPLSAVQAGCAALLLGLLSLSFLSASLLARHHSAPFYRLYYSAAAVWLGAVNFLFWASWLIWASWGISTLFHLDWPRRDMLIGYYGAALLLSVYALINAGWTRVRHVRLPLAGLPENWHGRRAALVSDIHLGHVRGARFLRKLAGVLRGLEPDVVFIAGDLFDGTPVDAEAMLTAWVEVRPPLGSWFTSGNHDEFLGASSFHRALENAGISILSDELRELEELQVAGVSYPSSVNEQRYRAVLESLRVDTERAAILLLHVPHHLSAAEEAGFGLQLSGHTHRGQVFPFTWFTRRVFREFTWGLRRFGRMWVYTSSGAGTWGPPMRQGTQPEVVVFTLEKVQS